MRTFRNVILYGIAFSLFTGMTAFGQEVRVLPSPKIRGQVMKALKNRIAIKGFLSKELSDQDISNLLWAGFGIVSERTGRRTAPSAFNVQEIDIYVLKSDGAYMYDAEKQALVVIQNTDIRSLVATQNYAKSAPVQLVFVADYDRANAVYPSSFALEKEKWAMMHTGFIEQNITIYCASRGLVSVVRSAGNREELRQSLRLRDSQEIIMSQAIGHSPK